MKSKDVKERVDFEKFIRSNRFDSVTAKVLYESGISNGAFPVPQEISSYDDQDKDTLISIIDFRANNLASQGRVLNGADICIASMRRADSHASRSWVPLVIGMYMLIFIINSETLEIEGCMSLAISDDT